MSRYTTQAPKLALSMWRKRYPRLEPHQATAKHGDAALSYWLSCVAKARAKAFLTYPAARGKTQKHPNLPKKVEEQEGLFR